MDEISCGPSSILFNWPGRGAGGRPPSPCKPCTGCRHHRTRALTPLGPWPPACERRRPTPPRSRRRAARRPAPAARVRGRGYPISRLHLAYISPISRLYLAYISPISRLHLQLARLALERVELGEGRLQLVLGVRVGVRATPSARQHPAIVMEAKARPAAHATRAWYRGDVGEMWARCRRDVGEI